jgi:predicted nucleic acid-binding protein
MPKRRRDYVFDTVTLSNFALADSLDLLASRYGKRVRVTQEVLDEVTDGVVTGYSALRAVEEAVASGRFSSADPLTSKEERETYRGLLRVLAPGEASCIAFAAVRSGIVVTDDRTARDCCRERGVAFTGTVGILKACCLDGTLTAEAADTILERMVESGFYSPVKRISDLL